MNNFKKIRYDIVPQLKEYDLLSTNWKPYVMFFNKPNYKSSIYNLDKHGLRYNGYGIDKSRLSPKADSIFHTDLQKNHKKLGVVIGGSAAFGTGSSNDNNTIPSLLSEKTNTHFFNMGCSAFNGFQEIILFQNFIIQLEKVDKIVVYSGLNDIYLTYFNTKFDGLFDSHYFSQLYINEVDNATLSFKRKIAKLLFENFTNKNIDWKNITVSDLKKNFFQKKDSIKQKPIDRKIILRNLVKKNLKFWYNCQAGMKTKVIYVLQPFANWCNKKRSQEEEKLFSVTDNSQNKIYETFLELNKSAYIEYRSIIKEECDNLKIEFLDCNSYFNNEFDEKWLFVDRGHLTDLGNVKVAELIKSKYFD